MTPPKTSSYSMCIDVKDGAKKSLIQWAIGTD